MRGGAYKPRTSPYEFRGLGVQGLEILSTARDETGLAIITEVMSPADIETIYEYTDIFQIGARNCQNYILLEEVGKAGKPVMLKRGMSMLIEEWLLAAEYVPRPGQSECDLLRTRYSERLKPRPATHSTSGPYQSCKRSHICRSSLIHRMLPENDHISRPWRLPEWLQEPTG